MYYETMPLYPALREGCEREPCVRVPVFGAENCGPGRMPDACHCRRVTIENPCRPGERAEVLLGVDDCGNLVVCVRREPCPPMDCRGRRPDCGPRRLCPPPEPCSPPCPPPCPPVPCPPPRGGCRGRLYGSWR